MAKHRVIFLDRNGTLIDDVCNVKHSSCVCFYPFTFEALSLLQEHFLLFIITNQSGIAKGITTEKEVSIISNCIVKTLKEQGIVNYNVFCCPHRSDENCESNKHQTNIVDTAHLLFNIDLSRSFIIGDHPSDIQCGLNAGITPIYLLPGHGKKHQEQISKETVICSDLLEASKYIILKNNQI